MVFTSKTSEEAYALWTIIACSGAFLIADLRPPLAFLEYLSTYDTHRHNRPKNG